MRSGSVSSSCLGKFVFFIVFAKGDAVGVCGLRRRVTGATELSVCYFYAREVLP